jgi:hypothetical protein
LKNRRVQIPGVSLQPCDEPLLLTQRLPLAHKDLVLLALRTGPGKARRARGVAQLLSSSISTRVESIQMR